ncbi:NADH-quinone oxidoreductase subunit 5 family protein [Methanolacinia paynteri]|uniref:NADH-quinone oxidoreductase subunit 5 family protein n=1 Tax=Methanolacinia paynteri TaxID=230356 RepID=UPI00064E1886|nr:proton-conducting transporter membrane subunit [Methanolacinia paynteri]
MESLIFLILFPLIAGGIMLFLPNGRGRDLFVNFAAIVTCLGSLYLLFEYFGKGEVLFAVDGTFVDPLILAAEVAIGLFIIGISLKFKKYLVTVLAALQLAMAAYTEIVFEPAHNIGFDLFIDPFSLIMALIIGIIGSLICVYATGYMKTYHEHHKDVKDRRPLFFFLMFLFLSAMFGIVFSNNIMWLFLFWEITTLCSFLLIGYARDEVSWKNAFWALLLNVIGGVAFSGAILFINAFSAGTDIYLNELLKSSPEIALVAAAFIGFAGLTKSAQFPFSSWLVGAMVAPTPVSALLHSSTMVKAGVYVIVRFAPIYESSLIGIAFAFIGALTFLTASAIAISQSNAKKVLAYSTIANLGLVVACAGIGTEEAVWAAILLIIFHAVAKSLLFLSVGSVEHQKHSRDIEDMGGLIAAMPKIALMMLIGMAGMFLAPFGMLISKWASIHAFVNAIPPFGMLLIAIIAYGSGITVFFWTKWMGKIIEVRTERKPVEKEASRPEMSAILTLGGLTVLACLIFPLISSTMIEPYLHAIYHTTSPLLSLSNEIIMLFMIVVVILLPLSLFHFAKGRTLRRQYMGARVTEVEGEHLKFLGSMGVMKEEELSNYYFPNMFGEKELSRAGVWSSILIIVVMFALLSWVFPLGVMM